MPNPVRNTRLFRRSTHFGENPEDFLSKCTPWRGGVEFVSCYSTPVGQCWDEKKCGSCGGESMPHSRILGWSSWLLWCSVLREPVPWSSSPSQQRRLHGKVLGEPFRVYLLSRARQISGLGFGRTNRETCSSFRRGRSLQMGRTSFSLPRSALPGNRDYTRPVMHASQWLFSLHLTISVPLCQGDRPSTFLPGYEYLKE